MICNRHAHTSLTPTGGYYAEYGLWMCRRCFTEALYKAEDILLEARLAAMRLTSADALIRRLGGTR